MASTTSFKQQCPSCEAMVPIRDPGLIGRKIDCPKCKYRFVVEKPADKAKGDDDEDSGNDTPAPAKKAKKTGDVSSNTRVPAKKGQKLDAVGKSDKVAAGKPKTKPARPRDEDDESEEDRPRKKKSGVSMTVLLGAGLGGLALVLLVFGGLYMAGVFGGKSDSGGTKPGAAAPGNTGAPQANNNPGPGVKPPANNNPPAATFIADVTNLLPNDAETVVNYQIDKLHDSGLGQTALSPGAFSEKAFRDTFAFPLYAEGNKGVERVVTAISNSKHWVFTVLHAQKGVTIEKDKLIANLQLEAHDPVNGLTPYSVKGDLDGLSNLLIKANRPHEDLQMVMLDGQTLVFADPAPMQKFLSDVKEFKGHPEFKTQPTQVAPPPSQSPQPGGMPMGGMNPNAGSSGQMGGMNPNGGGTGSVVPGASGPMGGMGQMGGMNPNGGTGSLVPGASGSMGGMNPNGGGTGHPANAGGASSPPQLVGSYLTLDPGMKAVFDRIEKSDQPILISAVMSGKDPLMDQLSRLVQGRAASWASSKEVGADEQTRSMLGMVKVFRPQDESATLIGFSLSACSADKINGVVVVDMGTPEVAKPLFQKLQFFFTLANALLGGSPGGANPDGMNPGGMNPGGTGAAPPPGPFHPATGGGPPAGSSGGPAGNPNGMNPGGMNMGGSLVPGGTIIPGGMNPGGMNPGGVDSNQGQGPLTLTQDRAFIQLNAALVFSGEKTKSKVDQEMGQLVTRLKAGAETASSRSRIHELAAALQRYVQANGHFPRGTADRSLTSARFVKWAPNQRVSWMAELLPYLDEGEFGNLPVDGKNASWSEGNNLRFASVMIPQYISHSDPSAAPLVRYPGVPLDVAVTNYVGVAGRGLDAADYPPGDPRDGIFGYDRETKPEEIKRGPDKTIALLQIPAGKTPWMAGGGATIRGVSEGPDALAQFVCADYQGRRGTFAVMGDFKVRFIPENIDPSKFTAMCTIAGAEKLDDIDQIAPVVPGDNPVLKTALPDAGPEQPSDKGDAPAGWQLVKSEDGFSVLMPEGQVGKLSPPPQKTPVGEMTANVTMVITKTGTAFNVTAGDLSKLSLKPGDSETFLDSAAQGLTATLPPGSKVTSQGKSTLDGNPGREIVMDIAGKATVKVRLTVVGSHLFVLTAAGPDKDMQTFFDSFKATAKGAEAPPVKDAPPPTAKDPPPASADPTKSDMDKIQGAWKEQQEFGRNGEEVRLVFVDRWQFHGQKAVQVMGRENKEFTFKLDPTQKPAAIDMIDADGKVLPGIYEFDGDLVKMSFDQHGNKGRPTAFDKITIIKIFGRDNP